MAPNVRPSSSSEMCLHYRSGKVNPSSQLADTLPQLIVVGDVGRNGLKSTNSRQVGCAKGERGTQPEFLYANQRSNKRAWSEIGRYSKSLKPRWDAFCCGPIQASHQPHLFLLEGSDDGSEIVG